MEVYEVELIIDENGRVAKTIERWYRSDAIIKEVERSHFPSRIFKR